MSAILYTIGHSNYPIERLMELLVGHSITVVFDVRSQPYSKYNPQFNRENLKSYLVTKNIRYEFLGMQLGARSKDPAHYRNGKVDYVSLAASAEFRQGLERICQSLGTENSVLLCAEKDPLQCHRAILIARELGKNGVTIQHILEDGKLESTVEFESRLLRTLKLPEQDLFSSREEILARAYQIQGNKIAYSDDAFEPASSAQPKQTIKIHTIGFTQKPAEEFFTKLQDAKVKRVIDIRLNNISQLAGFAKRKDLEYFLRVICGMDYVHLPILAPTQELLDAYKKQKGDWEAYEKEFTKLMGDRKIEDNVSKELLNDGCLLCSEHEPVHCHRRLVAEYLHDKWCDVDIQISHIV